MIKSLSIKNYAIIEELDIRFSDGLTIITGETGAGKSIVLGALGLIMGKRADSKSLYDLSKKCSIEGIFEVTDYKLEPFFEENDLDYENEMVVRRELTPSGKSRAFVNDTPVNLKILQKLSSSLIDLHQQFDTLDIHEVSFQLRMLDALAGNGKLLAKYGQQFNEYQAKKRLLQKLKTKNAESAKEVDYLNYLLEEFNAAELQENEQETLEEELQQLTNAEDIKRTLAGVYQHLSESEQAIINQLQDISVSISNVSNYHQRVAQLAERFNSQLIELQDISQEFGQIVEDTEYDGARIQEIQDRLDLIYRLQNKHNVASVSDLLHIQDDFQKQLDAIGGLSSDTERLEEKINEQIKQLHVVAEKLSHSRKKIILPFEKKVHKLLGQLAMEHARMKIEMKNLGELSGTGMDEVNFLFAANRGSRLQPIKDVASGGELSRLTLVTKSLVASTIPLPTLIFDEIDSGISGDVALKMGNILRQLSNEHQVVTITHSPQISAKADAHYFVYKKEKKDRTITKVKLLNPKERTRALAVMLSQNPPSEAALENARELLGY